MAELSNNPFEQPHAESPPVADPPRRALLLGGLAIVLVDQLSREVSRNGMVTLLTSSGDFAKVSNFYTAASIVGAFGPLVGALLGYFAGPRRALIAGAILSAIVAAGLIFLPSAELAAAGALARGMIWTPLAVWVGRSLANAPERRDAWFTSTIAVLNVGGFIGGLVPLGSLFPSPVVFSVSAAFSLAIIPLAVWFISASSNEDTNYSSNTSVRVGIPLIFGLFAILAVLRQLRFTSGDRMDAIAAVVAGGVAFVASIVAAVIYLSRDRPGQKDSAKIKIALGSVLAASVAVLLVSRAISSIQPLSWAAGGLDEVSGVLIEPIAMGIAATRPRAKDAYIAVAILSTGRALLAGVGPMLAPRIPELILGAAVAVIAFAIGAYLFATRDR